MSVDALVAYATGKTPDAAAMQHEPSRQFQMGV